MTKKVLKALKGSIKKWESIVKGTGEEHGSKNCPLCKALGTMNYDDFCGEVKE